MPLRLTGRKGLSILEILIASLIISVVMVGLVNVFMASRRFFVGGRSQTIAAGLLRYYLSPLMLEVNQTQWSTNCLGSNTSCPGTGISVNNITYTPSFITSAYTPSGCETLRKVNLTISWEDPS